MKRNLLLSLSSAQIVIFVAALLCAHPSHVRADDHALQAQIDLLKQELALIKQLLQGGAPPVSAVPENLTVNIKNKPFKGQATAKLTLVEFSDYECPFCANFFSETMPRIEQDFISTGKLGYVRRDFPLSSIHPNAVKAAEAANCAGKQGKYWEMHSRLFANQNQLRRSELPEHAKAIGLDSSAFERCLDDGDQAEIQRDVEEGLKVGVQGTPTVFLGVHEAGSGSIKVLKAIVGAQPYSQFKQDIEWALQRIGK